MLAAKKTIIACIHI